MPVPRQHLSSVLRRRLNIDQPQPNLEKAKSKVTRKTLKKPPPPKRNEAMFRTGQAIALARDRNRMGIQLMDLEYTTPASRVLALQVKNEQHPKWGNVKAFPVHEYTPLTTKMMLERDLETAKLGWIMNGYFGSDASFRIKEVVQPQVTTVY